MVSQGQILDSRHQEKHAQINHQMKKKGNTEIHNLSIHLLLIGDFILAQTFFLFG